MEWKTRWLRFFPVILIILIVHDALVIFFVNDGKQSNTSRSRENEIETQPSVASQTKTHQITTHTVSVI